MRSVSSTTRLVGTLLVLLLASGVAAQSASNASLAGAARAGDHARVSALLSAGVDVRSAERDGTTALHWAVYHDDTEMVADLTAAGADPNRANRNAATPLGLACRNADPVVIGRLLGAGADPNQPASGGEPPLLTCARTGRVAATDQLVAAGADVNSTETWRGQTALMWAAAENHAPMVRWLLDHGARIDRASSGGFTALLFAVRQGAIAATRVLLEAGADVNISVQTQSALHVAVTNRHYSVATLLLAYGADPDAAARGRRSALHALVGARAPSRRDRGPVTDPMRSLGFMELLLEYGADPNARTEPGRKLTDRTVSSALRPALDNVLNTGGATPYFLASQTADVEAMRLLHTHGADPLIPTFEDTTTLMVAAGIVFVEGRPVRSQDAALDAVKLALAAGVDVDAVNEQGQSAVHGAVYRGADRIITLLADAGASLDLQDQRGRTPLDLAEQGFNQVSSVIRRDSEAALLRELGAARNPWARSGLDFDWDEFQAAEEYGSTTGPSTDGTPAEAPDDDSPRRASGGQR